MQVRSLANAAKLLSPVIARFGQLNHPKWRKRPFWALRATIAIAALILSVGLAFSKLLGKFTQITMVAITEPQKGTQQHHMTTGDSLAAYPHPHATLQRPKIFNFFHIGSIFIKNHLFLISSVLDCFTAAQRYRSRLGFRPRTTYPHPPPSSFVPRAIFTAARPKMSNT